MSKSNENRMGKWAEEKLNMPVKRRGFLQAAGLTTAASFIPSKEAKAFSFAKFFQKHYKEMTPKQKEKAFSRIAQETKSEYGVEVNVTDPLPMEGVKYAYCLNLSACNGNRLCVSACQKENNIDDSIQSYIRVLEMPAGTFNLEHGDKFYNHETVPKKDKFYLPVQCNHCDNSPCTKVCPVEATWKEKDGLVVVDYDWCIGCRYCQAACPYEARHFNWSKPKIDISKLNPNQSYLSNRIRPKGVMEKCTFCLHRTRNNQYPACLEACPTGARKFGNILDPYSEVSEIFKKKRVFVLKEELNTMPQFFYYFG